MFKIIQKTTLVSAIALLATIAPMTAIADESGTSVVEDNAQQRINLSGKLRMLSQRIPAAACHMQRGIAVESASALLTEATDEFHAILVALEFGDEAMGIQAVETRRKTLAGIAALHERWDPMEAAAMSVLAGTATDDEMTYIMMENTEILRVAQRLVEEMVKQYANPNAASRAQLMQIDIAGRQRMLTQKMLKESCMLSSDYAEATTMQDLDGTARIFNASLEALQFGMASVGVMPPPNAGIEDGLRKVSEDWMHVEPYVTELLSGGSLDDAAHAEKFKFLNMTMADMNTVVGMYTTATQ